MIGFAEKISKFWEKNRGRRKKGLHSIIATAIGEGPEFTSEVTFNYIAEKKGSLKGKKKCRNVCLKILPKRLSFLDLVKKEEEAGALLSVFRRERKGRCQRARKLYSKVTEFAQRT